jgi:hypothetical protein
MKCHFCWDEGTETALTKEHLLSDPVARAFRLQRPGMSFARFDRDDVLRGDLDGVKWAGLESLAVRIACATCNNGWMNDLEHEMATVARWNVAGSRPLGQERLEIVQRWLLKTYIVLSVIEGSARRFGSDDADFGVIPEVTRASQLRRGDSGAFDGVAVGIARTGSENFAYGFGNPSVVPKGPRYANSRSAGVAAVSLGSLQLWIVVPWFRHATTRLPRGVAVASAGLRARRLTALPSTPDTLAPVVDNGEHDMEELMAALIRGAAEESRINGGSLDPTQLVDPSR